MDLFSRFPTVILGVFLCSASLSCVHDPETIAQSLIDQSIQAHGQGLLITSEVRFRFREKNYLVNRGEHGYIYERQFVDKGDSIIDRLYSGGDFERIRNKKPVQLPDSLKRSYANSLNSVLYFFQLPYVLNDPSANKRYVGPSLIKGRPYFVVAVTFDQEGGGDDYEDEFRYWFDAENLRMDFLAYCYHTNGGGVRFRVARNQRPYDGLWVQDYDNYRPLGTDTPLDSLAVFWERGALKTVSHISKEQVRVLMRN